MKNPHLKLGDTSRYVKHLIRALRRSNFTESAYWKEKKLLSKTRYRHFTSGLHYMLWNFQSQNGLTDTGECDAATWAKLERFL